MEFVKTFLEQQSLPTVFLVIGIGYALGGLNIRGFSLGLGAVLFVDLAARVLAPGAPRPRCSARLAC